MRGLREIIPLHEAIRSNALVSAWSVKDLHCPSMPFHMTSAAMSNGGAFYQNLMALSFKSCIIAFQEALAVVIEFVA